jgi:hypothetical protein
MAGDKATRNALDLRELQIPRDLPVVRVEVEDYTDWTGDAALRVLVVLDESVDPATVSGEAVGDLKWSIQKSLRKHGVTLFPYIFLAKQSELTEANEE